MITIRYGNSSYHDFKKLTNKCKESKNSHQKNHKKHRMTQKNVWVGEVNCLGRRSKLYLDGIDDRSSPQPECQKKSRKIDFTSFFMHKNFVKSNFKAKLQSLCSKNLQNMSQKIRYSAFSRKFAQMRPLLQDSTQNLIFIRV